MCSDIIVYVSSCLHSYKHNISSFVGSIFKHYTVRWMIRVAELITKSTVDLFLFTHCSDFELGLGLNTNHMLLLWIADTSRHDVSLSFVFDASCRRSKVLEYVCGMMYRVINTSKVNLALYDDEHAHTYTYIYYYYYFFFFFFFFFVREHCRGQQFPLTCVLLSSAYDELAMCLHITSCLDSIGSATQWFLFTYKLFVFFFCLSRC